MKKQKHKKKNMPKTKTTMSIRVAVRTEGIKMTMTTITKKK